MDEIGVEINNRILEHSKQTALFMRKFEKFDELFRCIAQHKKEENQRANTFVAEFFRCIETDVSGVDNLMFSEEPFFFASPTDLTDQNIEKAENTQALLEKEAEGTVFNQKLRIKLQPALRSLLQNGTAVARVPFTFKERWVKNGASFDKRTMINSPDFIHVPLNRFHFDPFGTDVEMCRWVGERYHSDKRSVVAMIEAAKSVPGAIVNELEDGDWVISGGAATEGETQANIAKRSRGYTYYDDKRPVIVDYWGEHPDKDKETDPIDWRIITLNGKTIIQMQNPYAHGLKPYVKATLIDLEESFYGLGFGHIMELPQLEINDFQNLTLDAIALSIYNIWQKESGVEQRSKQSMRLKPGMIIDLMRDGKMTPLITNLQGIAPAMEIVQQRANDMRGASAATAIQQSIPTDVSAREVSAMGNASDRRQEGVAMIWADRMVRKVLWMWHEMNKQYKTEPEMVNIQNAQGMMEPRMVTANRETVDPLTGQVSFESDILEDADIRINMAIDKQNVTGMIRRITTAMEALSNSSQNIPNLGMDFTPIFRGMIKQLMRLMGIRPLMQIPPAPPAVLTPPVSAAAGETPGLPPGVGNPPPENPSAVDAAGVSAGLSPVPETLPPAGTMAGGIMPGQ